MLVQLYQHLAQIYICYFWEDFYKGLGQLGSVVSAMIADLVKEEERAHAMAIMGGTIALSFAVAMIVAPIVGGNWGIDKLFWLTAK